MLDTHALNVATYNIHKGFSQFNRRLVVHELRDRLHDLNSDIVFLQEVQGAHNRHGARLQHYPDAPQHEFIAGAIWPHTAYGRNAVYEKGHHGNAILSRFPIIHSLNSDISAHRFESRGLLHCQIALAGQRTVHCICAHFGLFQRGRRAQTQALVAYVKDCIPAEAPLIVAGDFNDWRNHMGSELADTLELQDVFAAHEGRPARSFPARLPMFRLDRIYVRGFGILHSKVHTGEAWQRLSDHAALSARLKWHE
jgi:endonuclease/exonuclease/phosphatase family metal-dependent hydrolase